VPIFETKDASATVKECAMEEIQRVALGYKVVLTAGGEPAAAALRDQGLDTHFRPFDPVDREEVASLIEALTANPGRIDVLIADASTQAPDPSACRTLCLAVLPLMRSQGYGRIALLAGSEPECGCAAEATGDNVKINAVCPVDEKAEIALWLATLPDDGPTGGVFRCRDEEGEAKS
jgi:hypothetical protein